MSPFRKLVYRVKYFCYLSPELTLSQGKQILKISSKMANLKCFLLPTLLIVATAEAGAAELKFSIGMPTQFFENQAFVRMLDGFVGERSGGVGIGGSSPGSSAAPNATRTENFRNSALSLRLSESVSFKNGAFFDANLALSLGRLSVFLPDGAAPFFDPIQIQSDYIQLTPTISLGHSPKWLIPYGIKFAGGVGYEMTSAKSTAKSALLDVKSEGEFANAFSFAQVTWACDCLSGIEVVGGIADRNDHTALATLSAQWSF